MLRRLACLTVAALLGLSAPASAATGVYPITLTNGKIGLTVGTASLHMLLWNNSLAQWELVALTTTDFNADFSGDSLTLDPSVTQAGSCVGDGDICAYANGGLQIPATSSCPSADCDAAGEFGKWCPNSTAGVVQFCLGAAGWAYVGDMRNVLTNTTSSSAITSTAETGFSNGTFTVPNSQPVVGTYYEIMAAGIYSTTTGTHTTSLVLKFGSTAILTLATPSGALPASMSNRGWSCRLAVTWRAVTDGAATVVTSGTCMFNTSGSDGTTVTISGASNGTVGSLDTVGQDGTIQLFNDWVGASNSITLQQWQVEQRK